MSNHPVLRRMLKLFKNFSSKVEDYKRAEFKSVQDMQSRFVSTSFVIERFPKSKSKARLVKLKQKRGVEFNIN